MQDRSILMGFQPPAGRALECAVQKLRDTQNGPTPAAAAPAVHPPTATPDEPSQDDVQSKLQQQFDVAYADCDEAVRAWLGNQPIKIGLINCPEFTPRLAYARIDENEQAQRIMTDDKLQTAVAQLINNVCRSLSHCELAMVFYADTLPYGRPPDLPAAIFSCIDNESRQADLLASLTKASETKFTYHRLQSNGVVIGLSGYRFPLHFGKIHIPDGRSAVGDRINTRLRREGGIQEKTGTTT